MPPWNVPIPKQPPEFNKLMGPQWSRLSLEFVYFWEHQSTDDFLQGANDEVFLTGFGVDSSTVRAGADTPVVPMVIPREDVSDPAFRDHKLPVTLLSFDLKRAGSWPTTYTATVLTLEEDNQNIANVFIKFRDEVSAAVRTGLKGVPIVGTTLGDKLAAS